jgi:hypothetical protein
VKPIWRELPIFWFLWATHWIFAHRVMAADPGRVWCPDCLRSWPAWYVRRAARAPSTGGGGTT